MSPVEAVTAETIAQNERIYNYFRALKNKHTTQYSPKVREITPEIQDGINSMIRDKVISGEAIEDCLNLSYYLYWLRKLYRYGEIHEYLSNSILEDEIILTRN